MVATSERVTDLTAEDINLRIRTQTQANVAFFADHPELISQRLRELDAEWDIERVIELEVSGTILTGALLGLTVNRKWFLMPLLASAMLLIHNVQGSYPLLPFLRRLGLRTAREIAQERYALKAVRGDFDRVDSGEGATRVQAAFRAAHANGVGHEGGGAAVE